MNQAYFLSAVKHTSRKSRKNTPSEKRCMRNSRKRRKRQFQRMEKDQLTKELAKERLYRSELEQQSHLNRKMAKSFWERWRYELDQRKQLLLQAQKLQLCTKQCRVSQSQMGVPLINQSLLVTPDETASDLELYVGRGSFSVVKHLLYRGIHVAVKEFLPQTCPESVYQEASILLRICHPYLPLIFGVCTSAEPYCIVMQYYGIDGKSITLQKELIHRENISECHMWLVLCAQMVEAIRYLHEDAKIIHNDIKSNNILLTRSLDKGSSLPSLVSDYQVVVTDFGKATSQNDGRKYELTQLEKHQYYCEHHHIAPEVIEGITKQTMMSDIFSLGKILSKVYRSVVVTATSVGVDVKELLEHCVTKCISEKLKLRPSACSIANTLETILRRIPCTYM